MWTTGWFELHTFELSSMFIKYNHLCVDFKCKKTDVDEDQIIVDGEYSLIVIQYCCCIIVYR